MTEANNYMFELLERGQELTKLVCYWYTIQIELKHRFNNPV